MLANFEHTQGLSNVSFNKTITMFCPLGNDYYTATVYVEFKPKKLMMDYLDMEQYFKDIQGEPLIIEDLTAQVYNKIDEMITPEKLTVTVHAENATHFPVSVTKTSTHI